MRTAAGTVGAAGTAGAEGEAAVIAGVAEGEAILRVTGTAPTAVTKRTIGAAGTVRPACAAVAAGTASAAILEW